MLAEGPAALLATQVMMLSGLAVFGLVGLTPSLAHPGEPSPRAPGGLSRRRDRRAAGDPHCPYTQGYLFSRHTGAGHVTASLVTAPGTPANALRAPTQRTPAAGRYRDQLR